MPNPRFIFGRWRTPMLQPALPQLILDSLSAFLHGFRPITKGECRIRGGINPKGSKDLILEQFSLLR